jgi:hypothetical protein
MFNVLAWGKRADAVAQRSSAQSSRRCALEHPPQGELDLISVRRSGHLQLLCLDTLLILVHRRLVFVAVAIRLGAPESTSFEWALELGVSGMSEASPSQ